MYNLARKYIFSSVRSLVIVMRAPLRLLIISLLIIVLTWNLSTCQENNTVKIKKDIYLRGGYVIIVDSLEFNESYSGKMTLVLPRGWGHYINYTKLIVSGGQGEISSISNDTITLSFSNCRKAKLYIAIAGVYFFREKYVVTVIPAVLAPKEMPAMTEVYIHYPEATTITPPEGFNITDSVAKKSYGLLKAGTNILLNTSFSYERTFWIVCYELRRVISIQDYSKATIEDTYTLANVGPKEERGISISLPAGAKVLKVRGVLGEYFEGAKQGYYRVENQTDLVKLDVGFRYTLGSGEKLILTVIYQVPLRKSNGYYVVPRAFSSNGLYVVKSRVKVEIKGSLEQIEPSPETILKGNTAIYRNKIVPISEVLEEGLDLKLKFSTNILQVYAPLIALAAIIGLLTCAGFVYLRATKVERKTAVFDERKTALADLEEALAHIADIINRTEGLTRALSERKVSRRAFKVQVQGLQRDCKKILSEARNKALYLAKIEPRVRSIVVKLSSDFDKMEELYEEVFSILSHYPTRKSEVKEMVDKVEQEVIRLKKVLSTMEERVLDIEDML